MWTVTEYRDTDDARLEFSRVLAIWRGYGFAFWSDDDIINACHIPGTTLILLAEEKGDCQGMALARRLDQAVELFYLYVSPRHRGQGLSHMLLDRLFNQYSSVAQEMFLEVRASNEAAQRTYKKYGFKQISLRQGYYPNGEDALIMQMPIKERYGDFRDS